MNAPSGAAQPPQELQEAMRRVGLRECDLEERFIRSSGPGGQRVNKVSTCVVLRHVPSGLEVRCQQERSQLLNRLLARRMLLQRLADRARALQQAEAEHRAIVRRQKHRRSGAAKERVLAAKKLHARKKALRRLVKPERD